MEVNITELTEEVKMHENNMATDSLDNANNTEKPSADAILIRLIHFVYFLFLTVSEYFFLFD